MVNNIVKLCTMIFEKFFSKDSMVERKRNELSELQEKRKELVSKPYSYSKSKKILVITKRINAINKWMRNRQ